MNRWLTQRACSHDNQLRMRHTHKLTKMASNSVSYLNRITLTRRHTNPRLSFSLNIEQYAYCICVSKRFHSTNRLPQDPHNFPENHPIHLRVNVVRFLQTRTLSSAVHHDSLSRQHTRNTKNAFGIKNKRSANFVNDVDSLTVWNHGVCHKQRLQFELDNIKKVCKPREDVDAKNLSHLEKDFILYKNKHGREKRQTSLAIPSTPNNP